MNYKNLVIIIFLTTTSINLASSQDSVSNKTYVARTLLTASTGVACEVIFTALCNFYKTKNFHLEGSTYAWMLFIYSVIYPLHGLVHPKVAHLKTPLRGLLYLLFIYAGEYSSGLLFRKLTGAAPWEKNYKDQRWSIDDLIRLDYAPAWFMAGLMFEHVCNVLKQAD